MRNCTPILLQTSASRGRLFDNSRKTLAASRDFPRNAKFSACFITASFLSANGHSFTSSTFPKVSIACWIIRLLLFTSASSRRDLARPYMALGLSGWFLTSFSNVLCARSTSFFLISFSPSSSCFAMVLSYLLVMALWESFGFFLGTFSSFFVWLLLPVSLTTLSFPFGSPFGALPLPTK